MSEELQTETQDDITLDQDDSVSEVEFAETGTPEEGAELAPAQAEESDNNTNDGGQDAVQKVINRKHWEAKEAERRAEAAEQRAKESEERLKKLEAQKDDITIPPMPDQWDDDYETKIRERENAIAQKARADAAKQAAEDAAFKAQQDEQLRIQRETNAKLDSYAKRATESGIKREDLATAVKRVADAGIPQAMAEFLLTDESGPLITAYLADERNTVELFSLASMSPIEIGMKLPGLRAKAAELKNQGPSAPPPPDTISGRGKVDNEDPRIAGAYFE